MQCFVEFVSASRRLLITLSLTQYGCTDTSAFFGLLRPSTRNSSIHAPHVTRQPDSQKPPDPHTAAHRLTQASIAAWASPKEEAAALLDPKVKGPAKVIRQVSQYGIEVGSWEPETLKIVIPVENHPQKPKNWLADYDPSGGGECSSADKYIF